MQENNKYTLKFIRRPYRLWTFFLLLISGTILIFLILGIPPPPLLILFFCSFIPGYSLVALVFSELNDVEKVVASMGLNIGFFVGLKSLIQISGFIGIISEVVILTIFSVILLIVKLVR